MSKKTIYMHVGPHKTGSTVLQKACLDNRNILETSGIKYPALFFSHIGHHLLVDMIRREEITADIVATVKGLGSDLLFSSENFISLTKHNWQYFVNCFADYNIQVIYAWRRSSQKMYSLWQENVKHGGVKSFTDFYYKELIRPGQSDLLCPHLQLDKFASVLSKDNIKILDYDASKSTDSLISDFFTLLSIDASLINIQNITEGIKNESLPPEFVEILRCLNRKYSLSNNSSSYVRERFFSCYEQVKEDIELISNNMSDYCESLIVGDYFVDKISEKRILETYTDNIFNYKKNKNISSIKIISSDWVINNISNDALHRIYTKLGLKEL